MTCHHADPAPGPRTDPVVTATERLARLPGLRRALGVVHMWPEQPCAEHECVERLRAAAALIGVRTLDLDRYGHRLGTPRQKVTRAEVDFVIHLHYETGKTYDAPSVAAMWNPTQFYFDWGFDRHWANQMSHDIYAYTGATQIRRLVQASRGEEAAADMPLLNHTLAGPIVAPRAHAPYRVLYCGINWERLGSRVGRHAALLQELDRAGVLEVYGPELIRGVQVWAGYQGYRGPIPFDGHTIVDRIAHAGACLVLSSAAHLRSGIMSNRLFEAMAAGAVIIGDDHPFIPTAVGANFVRVPTALPTPERAAFIVESLRGLAAEPQRAVAMARAAQQALVDRYHLCDQLAGVYESVARFTARTDARRAATRGPVIDLVVQPIGNDTRVAGVWLQRLSAACRGRAVITALVDANLRDWLAEHDHSLGHTVVLQGEANAILNPWECLELVSPHLSCAKIAFLLGIEELFIDTFMQACDDSRGHPVARLGHALRHGDDGHDPPRYDYCRGAGDLNSLHEAAVGCVVFDREWLTSCAAVYGTSWKDTCRAAAAAQGSVVDCPVTALVIDITEYERALAQRRRMSGTPVDAAALARLACPAQQSLSTNAVVIAYTEASVATRGAPELEPGGMLATVRAMPRAEQQMLLISLYHALPLPAWLRFLVRLCRWAAGVR
jgi:hypothetical protein